MPAWKTPSIPGGPGMRMAQPSIPMRAHDSPNVMALPSACTTPQPQASSHMPTRVEPPVDGRLDEEPGRVARAAEDVQSIRELLGHPCELLGEAHDTLPTTARVARWAHDRAK